MKKKSKTSENIVNLINHLKASKDVTVKNIQCDNAGENKNLRKDAMRDGLSKNFQFTAPYTPQQNGTIERSFVMSYERKQAMLKAAGIHGKLRSFLWAEAANYENDTDNVLIRKGTEVAPTNDFLGNSQDIRITCANPKKSR